MDCYEIGHGLCDMVVFDDNAKRLMLIHSPGDAHIGILYSTSEPASASTNGTSTALSLFAYVKQIYDATVALALAAQGAGWLESTPERAQHGLPRVPPAATRSRSASMFMAKP